MGKNPKTVLVTGAANGIGLEITKFLAENNDIVIATDFSKESLAKLEGAPNIHPIYMDVTNIDTIHEAAKKIASITDSFDCLINNAGIFVGGPMVEVDLKEMEKIVDVNILGVFRVTKVFFPFLYKAKGKIINIGSEAGRFSYPLNGPYSITKYALESFSDSLRRELMFLGMDVIILEIGACATSLLQKTYCDYDNIDQEKSYFTKQLNLVVKTCENELKRGANPKVVAKRIYRLIHKKRTRARYRIKNNKTRRILEFLPTGLVDFAMKKILK